MRQHITVRKGLRQVDHACRKKQFFEGNGLARVSVNVNLMRFRHLLFVVYRGLGDEKFEVPWSATTAKRNEKFVLVTNSSGMVNVVFVVCKVSKVDNMWANLIYNLCALKACRRVNKSSTWFAIRFTDKDIEWLLYVTSVLRRQNLSPRRFEPMTSPADSGRVLLPLIFGETRAELGSTSQELQTGHGV